MKISAEMPRSPIGRQVAPARGQTPARDVLSLSGVYRRTKWSGEPERENLKPPVKMGVPEW